MLYPLTNLLYCICQQNWWRSRHSWWEPKMNEIQNKLEYMFEIKEGIIKWLDRYLTGKTYLPHSVWRMDKSATYPAIHSVFWLTWNKTYQSENIKFIFHMKLEDIPCLYVLIVFTLIHSDCCCYMYVSS